MRTSRGLRLIPLACIFAVGCSIAGQNSLAPTASDYTRTAKPTPVPAQSFVTDTGDGAGYVDPETAAKLFAVCPAGDVSYYFAIPVGSSLQAIFPSAGKTPELDGVSGLVVFVYSGDVLLLLSTATAMPDGPTQRSTYSDVLCAVSPAGRPDVYYDVARDGMRLPEGAQHGPVPSR